MPQGKDGNWRTARSKGKGERLFRTVKEMHETLYHFQEPETKAEANVWLLQFLEHCNSHPHRSEPHSRMDDWLANIPSRRYSSNVFLGAVLYLRTGTGAAQGWHRWVSRVKE